MADADRVINIVFRSVDELDTVSISSEVDRLGTSLNGINSSFDLASSRIISLGDDFVRFNNNSIPSLKTISDIVEYISSLETPAEQAGASVQILGKLIQKAGAGLQATVPGWQAVTLSVIAYNAALLTVAHNLGQVSSEIEKGRDQMKNIFPQKETEEFATLAKELYINGVAGSIEEAFEQVKKTVSSFKGSTNEDLADIASKSGDISDVFNVDFGKVIKSIQTLVEKHGLSTDQAFDYVVTKLRDSTDGGKQLFNSLSDHATKKNREIAVSVKGIEGAFDSLDITSTLEEELTGAFRAITTTLADDIRFDDIENRTKGLAESIKDNFKQAFSEVDTGPFLKELDGLIAEITKQFKEMDIDISTLTGLKNVINIVLNAMTTMASVSTGFAEGVAPLISTLKSMLEYFGNLDSGVAKFIGNLAGTSLTLAGFGLALTTSGGLLATMGKSVAKLNKELTLLSTLKNLGKLSIVFLVGWKIGKVISDKLNLDEPIQKAIRAIDSVINFSGQMGKVDLGDFKKKTKEAIEKETFKLKIDVDSSIDESLQNYFNYIDTYEKNINQIINVDGDFEAYNTKMYNVGHAKYADGSPILVEVPIDYNEEEYGEMEKKLSELVTLADGKKVWVPISIDKEKTKKELDEKIPKKRMLEIKLQGDIDKEITKIKTQSEVIRDAFKYTASVEIAKAKASAEVLKSAFDNVGQSVSSLSGSVETMFSALLGSWNELSMIDQSDFMEILEKQQQAQEKALESQIKLNQAQIDFMNAKAKALVKGDGLIKIDSTGLEPSLEMIMWEILEKVQVRAAENSSEFLLGI